MSDTLPAHTDTAISITFMDAKPATAIARMSRFVSRASVSSGRRGSNGWPLEANGIELREDTAEVEAHLPFDREPPVGEVEARLHRPPRARRRRLSIALMQDCAAHALDGELDPGEPVARTDERRTIAGRGASRLAPRRVRLHVG